MTTIWTCEKILLTMINYVRDVIDYQSIKNAEMDMSSVNENNRNIGKRRTENYAGFRFQFVLICSSSRSNAGLRIISIHAACEDDGRSCAGIEIGNAIVVSMTCDHHGISRKGPHSQGSRGSQGHVSPSPTELTLPRISLDRLWQTTDTGRLNSTT